MVTPRSIPSTFCGPTVDRLSAKIAPSHESGSKAGALALHCHSLTEPSSAQTCTIFTISKRHSPFVSLWVKGEWSVLILLPAWNQSEEENPPHISLAQAFILGPLNKVKSDLLEGVADKWDWPQWRGQHFCHLSNYITIFKDQVYLIVPRKWYFKLCDHT